MDDELLKLECLKLSDGNIDMAQQQFDWIKGRNQNDTVGGGAAKVVGKDGKVEPPFKDYLKE